MTPRNLFNIILKIFALFFLRDIVYLIPEIISQITLVVRVPEYRIYHSSNDEIINLLLVLLALAFYWFIIDKLLFKTNYVIDKLKLDQGFNQDEFSFKLSTIQVLTIALFVIAGVILTTEIPMFCRHVFAYFQEKNITHGVAKPDFSYIITSCVKIVLGLLMIGERKRIVEFFENGFSNRKKEDDTDNS